MSGVQQTAWSRRRAAVRAEAEVEVKQATAATRARVQAEQAEKTDAEILSEFNLQDPDQMAPGDDFSAFLRDEVPQRLQRRALRVLWRSNPVLACVDDLLDYGDDFKAEGMGGAVVRTAYQVGKGMLAHVEEMQKQAADEVEDVIVDVAPDDAPPEEETAAVDPVATNPDVSLAAVTDEGAPDQDPEQPLIPPRMRFEFEETA